MMSRKRVFLAFLGLCALSLTASASVTDPNIITGAVAVNGTAPEPLVVVEGGLWQGALTFVDRPDPEHTTALYFGDANDLGGLDYVRTAMDDKTDPDVEYRVTVDKPGTLFLIIDNRVGSGTANDTTTPPDLGGGVMDWVGTMGFTQTDRTVNISTPGTVYAKSVTAGTYVLGAQNDGSTRAMYVVAAAPAGFNLRPTIAGVNATEQVAPGETLTVDATIGDDGVPGTGVAIQWTTVSKPDGATVTYSPNDTSEDVEVSFSTMGSYTLQVAADDGEKDNVKTIAVSVQIPTFAVQAGDWCDVSNDSNAGPDSARKSSAIYVKNYDDGSAQRRRVGYSQYDISGLKQAGKAFANCYFTWNNDKGNNYTTHQVYVYAINEDIDNLTLTGLTWRTAPGIDNTPPPLLNSMITVETLDPADISPLLGASNFTAIDVWENTPEFAALDEILNADDDGILTLMFIAYDPEHNAYEIRSPSNSTAEPETTLKGIILRGNVAKPTWATNPSPVINTSQSTSLAQLSWTNPAPSEEGATITCDVFIGTAEPNATDPDYGLATLATGISGNSVAIPAGTLAVNNAYHWVVDIHDSVAGTTRGYVWSFNTNNAVPTVTMEKPFQYLWLNNAGDPTSATAVLNAAASDDNFPNPYTLLWEQVDAPEGVTVTIDPNNVEDITLVLPQAGTYVFKLSADDGDLTGSASTEIFVGATPCDAAKEVPGYEQMPADIDNNCYVNMADLQAFAEQWLECHSYMADIGATCN